MILSLMEFLKPTTIATEMSIRASPRVILKYEILMTGRRIQARELEEMGMINEIVPADELMDRARALAEELCLAAPL